MDPYPITLYVDTGILTPNAARDMIGKTWLVAGGFPPGTFAQEQAAIEDIERARVLRDARDARLETAREEL